MRKLPIILLAGALTLGAAACDGNAQDDVDNIEENIEEGVNDVGEAVEDGGEELQSDTGGE